MEHTFIIYICIYIYKLEIIPPAPSDFFIAVTLRTSLSHHIWLILLPDTRYLPRQMTMIIAPWISYPSATHLVVPALLCITYFHTIHLPPRRVYYIYVPLDQLVAD